MITHTCLLNIVKVFDASPSSVSSILGSNPTRETDLVEIVKMSFLDAGISWDFGQDLEGKELGDWE